MKLHGKNASIRINGTPLTTATEWAFNVQREYVDVSVYGDKGKVFYAGLREVSGQFAGLLDVDSDGALVATMGDICTIALYAKDGSLVASGSGYVDCGAIASISDAVKVTGTIKGTGKWTIQGV